MRWPKQILLILAVLLSFWGAPALGNVSHLSEAEFIALSEKLSHKVNLFRTAWEMDPKAQFYGGTTRDFLYWVKGKFKDAKTRTEAEAVRSQLLNLSTIDVRDFIIGESDVDIISEGLELKAEQFGVKNIDSHGPDIFNPATVLGKTEVDQGFLPAEKIRLSRNGFQVDHFGNGAREIYTGKLTLHAPDPEKFAATKYAMEKINHPVLLALRYLRLQAMNHFNEVGRGFPDKEKLFDLDPASEKYVRETVQSVTTKPELAPYFEKERFGRLLNGVIQKMFRSYTSPTAAMELSKKFGVDRLPAMYEQVQPINQYLFARYDDPAKVKANLETFKAKANSLYEPLEKWFPDHHFYHGTRKDADFAAILRQGILPSEGGAAGDGLYGVNEANKEFSERWGGDKNRLVKFEIAPDAKLVDITKEPGKSLFRKFGKSETEFAEAFGIDILRYDYGDQLAFVVKNSEVLKRPQGVYREVLTLSRAIALAEDAATDPEKMNLLSESMKLSGFNVEESGLVADAWINKSGSLFELAPKQYFERLHESFRGGGLFSQSILDRAITRYAINNRHKLATEEKVREFLRAADEFSFFVKTAPTELYPLIEEWKKAGFFAAEAKKLAATPFSNLIDVLQYLDRNKVGHVLKHSLFLDRSRLEIDRMIARQVTGNPTEVENFLTEHMGYGFLELKGDPRKAYEEFAEESADRLEQAGLLGKIYLHSGRTLHYPADGTDALHVSLALRSFADKHSSADNSAAFPDWKVLSEAINAKNHPYFPQMRSRLMTAWRKNGMFEDFAKFDSMAELKPKLYELVLNHNESFPVLDEIGRGVFDRAKKLFAPDPVKARNDFLAFLQTPLSKENNQRTREVTLALLLESDSDLPARLNAMDGAVRMSAELPRGHMTVLDDWIDGEFLRLDPDFAMEILRTCSPPHPACRHLSAKPKLWSAVLKDSRYEKEAWEMVLGKFWPLSFFGVDFDQFPIPKERLEQLWAEGKGYWENRKSLNIAETATAESHSYQLAAFTEQHVMKNENFYRHPKAAEFIRGGIELHGHYDDYLGILRDFAFHNPLAAYQMMAELMPLSYSAASVLGLLEEEPWKSHPLASTWKAAAAPLNPVPGDITKISPKRQKIIQRGKNSIRHLEREIAAWAEAVKTGNPYRPKSKPSCVSWFLNFVGI